jgi:aldose 1-epimerase
MKKRVFGRDDQGRAVEEVTLESADAAVSILSYGSTVRDWRVDVDGRALPMTLGFPTLEGYLHFARSHGALCGRVANRIKGAAFELDGTTYPLLANNGPNTLHGGPLGLGKRIWTMETDSGSGRVQLSYASPDGEEGFPGAVAFTVTYRLDGPTLIAEMSGVPDRPTPINLANHNYYNLGGGGTVQDHILWLAAPDYTPVDADLIPTGEIQTVEGTPLDFREAREIGDADIDHNLVLDPERNKDKPSATVWCPRTEVGLSLVTAEPALQVFNAAQMEIAVPGLDGQRYGRFAGLCLEGQHFPDSLHQPEWPSIIRTPEAPYFQRLAVEIGPKR